MNHEKPPFDPETQEGKVKRILLWSMFLIPIYATVFHFFDFKQAMTFEYSTYEELLNIVVFMVPLGLVLAIDKELVRQARKNILEHRVKSMEDKIEELSK